MESQITSASRDLGHLDLESISPSCRSSSWIHQLYSPKPKGCSLSTRSKCPRTTHAWPPRQDCLYQGVCRLFQPGQLGTPVRTTLNQDAGRQSVPKRPTRPLAGESQVLPHPQRHPQVGQHRVNKLGQSIASFAIKCQVKSLGLSCI